MNIKIYNGGICVNRIKKYLKRCISIMLIGFVITASGCSEQELSKADTVVLSINGSKVYLNEMLYHVMLAEMQGQLYASIVGNGENYWDMKNEDGIVMRDATKELAMENAIRYEIFYKLAMEKGYTLTAEEIQNSKNKADNILKNIPPEQVSFMELTKEKLIGIQEKIAIATRYYEEYIIRLGIQKEDIIAEFDQLDFIQYDIQYIYAQKKDYDEIASLLASAVTSTDFADLAKGRKVTSGKLSFLEGKDTFGEEVILEDTVKSMSVGEVSEIIETVKGYYIIKLIDNTSTKQYDAAVEEAVQKATEEAFEREYASLKNNYKITINKKIWEPIVVGNTFIKK